MSKTDQFIPGTVTEIPNGFRLSTVKHRGFPTAYSLQGPRRAAYYCERCSGWIMGLPLACDGNVHGRRGTSYICSVCLCEIDFV